MEAIKNFLLNMLSNSDCISLMRIVTIITVISILCVWISICIYKKDLVDFPWGVVTVFSIVVTGKIIQKFVGPSS